MCVGVFSNNFACFIGKVCKRLVALTLETFLDVFPRFLLQVVFDLNQLSWQCFFNPWGRWKAAGQRLYWKKGL